MNDLACPGCSRPPLPEFAWCPWCGRRLAAACTRCYARLQPDWGWCPRCGQRVAGATGPAMRQSSLISEAERHNQQGIALYDQERFASAIEQFRQAIALEPSSPIYHGNAAVAYQEAGDLERAQFEYEKALELDPEDYSALLNLGYLHLARGNLEQAAGCWRQVMDKDSDGPDGEEARRALLTHARRYHPGTTK